MSLKSATYISLPIPSSFFFPKYQIIFRFIYVYVEFRKIGYYWHVSIYLNLCFSFLGAMFFKYFVSFLLG